MDIFQPQNIRIGETNHKWTVSQKCWWLVTVCKYCGRRCSWYPLSSTKRGWIGRLFENILTVCPLEFNWSFQKLILLLLSFLIILPVNHAAIRRHKTIYDPTYWTRHYWTLLVITQDLYNHNNVLRNKQRRVVTLMNNIVGKRLLWSNIVL